MRITLPLLTICFFVASCSAYTVDSVRATPWLAGSVRREAAVGRFEASGAARNNQVRDLSEALAFALRGRGFVVVEQNETERLLQQSGLPPQRLLTAADLARSAAVLPTRLYLQGRVQEQRTIDLVEERLQTLVVVDIHLTAGGEKIGEIRLYGNDLERFSALESRAMGTAIAERLDEMIGELPGAGGR